LKLNADIFPGNVKSYENLTKVYMINQQLELALENSRRVVKFQSGNPAVKEKVEALKNDWAKVARPPKVPVSDKPIGAPTGPDEPVGE
jgi:hypothetical protein